MDSKIIKEIKTQFFALRNGEIADRLRKAGSPYRIIFGLLVPQIQEVALSQEYSRELAQFLWDNVSTRESRLLATMVFPKDEFTMEDALKWLETVDTEELVDMFCFQLVRNVEGAESLVAKFIDNEKPLLKYFALRLSMNLLIIGRLKDMDSLKGWAEAEFARNDLSTKLLCKQIIDEIAEWQR